MYLLAKNKISQIDFVVLIMKRIFLTAVLAIGLFFCEAQTIPSWRINQVKNYYSKKSDSVYVINFWATFCKPCIAEIPYLQSVSRKYASQKVALLLVSLDLPAFYPGTVKKFADKNGITAPIVWLNESNADYFCPIVDKQWSGSMPATLFVNAATGYRKFIESEMTEVQFETELKRTIKGISK